jgi:hypothetical protein
MDDDARVRSDGLIGYQQWALAQGLIERIMDTSEMIERRFVDAATSR